MEELKAIVAQLERLNQKLDAVFPTMASSEVLEPALAYRWTGIQSRHPLQPIPDLSYTRLEDLLHIEDQKETLILNTQQFLRGYPANNALLWGSRGTGKSTLMRAILGAFGHQGLRMVDVPRTLLSELPDIQFALKGRPERFIIFCDDLAFEHDDANYKMLKATLEGSLSGTSDRFLIYATSNRRHLLPEYGEDNLKASWIEGELHQGEAVEEKISLSERFGLWLSFRAFNQDQYLDLVAHWLKVLGGSDDFERARADALRYALTRGSRSGRIAVQFARHWCGRKQLEQELNSNAPTTSL
jgi:predicted AAA+ superfamily ATPase